MTRVSDHGELLTVREVATRLGVTQRTVQRWVAEGRINGTRVGGRLRIPPAAVDDVTQLVVARDAVSRATPEGAGTGRPIHTVLIANRGEIAARVARTARRLGIRSVGIHPPGESLFASSDATEEVSSYLDGASVVAAAVRSGADAIHPGYGFLAENAWFAGEVERAGLVWIGPPPAAITAMGDKAQARRLAASLDVPVLRGYDGEEQDDDRLAAEADQVGWPLLVKPAAGGGGKGMRLVHQPAQLRDALVSARREAAAAFGDDRLILERHLPAPRHIEVQLLFDHHGHGVHLGTRDCSTQRRQQKIVEEAPAPAVDVALRERMGEAALAVAASVGYRGAGTVEFLLAADGSFYFLEMNTRLQVEHPVTELVTGRDLVADQVRIAGGEPLGLAQLDVRFDGHAIEARLYAEDPEHGFLPATGSILSLNWPAGDGIRVDAGIAAGDEVTPRYDPLLAKVIAHGETRPAALARLRDALDATSVLGVRTNLRFLRWLVRQPFFEDADTRTDTLASVTLPGEVEIPEVAWTRAAALLSRPQGDGSEPDPWTGGWRLNAPPALRLRAGDVERRVRATEAARAEREPRAVRAGSSVHVDVEGQSIEVRLAPPPSVADAVRHAVRGESGQALLTAPMPGKVIAIGHAVGDQVEQHEPLLVLEAMKMENAVIAPVPGIVTAIHVVPGQQVQRGDPVAEVSPLPGRG